MTDGRRRGPEKGYLVFDIETEIDKDLVRDAFHPGPGVTAELAYERLRTEHDGGFLPVTVHAPVSIAFGWVTAGRVLDRVEVLRGDELGEEKLVRSFWQRVEPFGGTLVTFSGRIFDLPVLELRALRYGLSLPWYFGGKASFRGRSDRHDDLYEALSNRGAARLRGGLDLLAKLVGLPGKGAVSGAMVQELWERGEYEIVHRYCRRDVVQTYFLFLRVERLRGNIDGDELRRLEETTGEFRRELDQP
jgi:hypothetical protein